MATNIAKYYTAELAEWENLISFYKAEVRQLSSMLRDVIQRNTIPGISAMVEEQQDKLNHSAKNFLTLGKKIHQQEGVLRTNDNYIENSSVKGEAEITQSNLRRAMQKAEKRYIDTKYGCYHFISDTLDKQQRYP